MDILMFKFGADLLGVSLEHITGVVARNELEDFATGGSEKSSVFHHSGQIIGSVQISQNYQSDAKYFVKFDTGEGTFAFGCDELVEIICSERAEPIKEVGYFADKTLSLRTVKTDHGVVNLVNPFKLIDKENRQKFMRSCITPADVLKFNARTNAPAILFLADMFGIGHQTIEYKEPNVLTKPKDVYTSLTQLYDVLYNRISYTDIILDRISFMSGEILPAHVYLLSHQIYTNVTSCAVEFDSSSDYDAEIEAMQGIASTTKIIPGHVIQLVDYMIGIVEKFPKKVITNAMQ